ncbi:MAG: addiction module toxin RelE [Gammaproteobacteria bacterium]|nr:addiction module toxin RelE [Gammaproteobacteria bacterium]
MTRPLRPEFPGALYHLTSRGDGREVIYFESLDREKFLEILGVVCQRYHWRCHAYCLMTNHYHLVIETIEPTLSKGMRQLNGEYTRWVNRQYYRCGHLFQGRYHAVHVEKESYLLALARYVILNPVRARMVEHPNDYPWSSYRQMIGSAQLQGWLENDWLLLHFGDVRGMAIRNFEQYIVEGIRRKESIWKDIKGHIYLSTNKYVEHLDKLVKGKDSLKEIPKVQTKVVKPLSWFAATYSDRPKMCYEAHVLGHYSMRESADFIGLHYQTVSRDILKYEKMMEYDA